MHSGHLITLEPRPKSKHDTDIVLRAARHILVTKEKGRYIIYTIKKEWTINTVSQPMRKVPGLSVEGEDLRGRI